MAVEVTFASPTKQDEREPPAQEDAEEDSSDSLLHEHLHEHLMRSWNRLGVAAIRGVVAGVVVRGGLHALSSLLWHVQRKKRQRTLTSSDALSDTLKYSAFLGTLGATYVLVDEGCAILLGKQRTAKWRALVAGAVAGQTLLLAGSKERHYSLATYVLLRGLVLLIRTGNKPTAHPAVRALLAPTRFKHGDTALMCASAAQIVYSFIMMPSTLPDSYVRFLNKQAAKKPFVWRAVQEQAHRNWSGAAPGPLMQLKGTPWEGHCGKTPCEFWHPGQRCHQHAVSIFPRAYARALRVYVPVYLVPAILVHRRKLLQEPRSILPKVLLGIARSSLFLSSFIAVAFGAVCAGIALTGTSTGPIIAASVWVGGLATLVEKKSRRMELALYCVSRAVESFSRCLVEWGAVQRDRLPARLDVLLFSAGCAAIMHCYSDSCGQHRDVFKSKYLNVLDFVFGNAGVHRGSIVHHPSNIDLIHSVHRRIMSLSSPRLRELARSSSIASSGSAASFASQLQSPAAKGAQGAAGASAGPSRAASAQLPEPAAREALGPQASLTLLQKLDAAANAAAAAAAAHTAAALAAAAGTSAAGGAAADAAIAAAAAAAVAAGRMDHHVHGGHDPTEVVMDHHVHGGHAPLNPPPPTFVRRSFTEPCMSQAGEKRVHGGHGGAMQQASSLLHLGYHHGSGSSLHSAAATVSTSASAQSSTAASASASAASLQALLPAAQEVVAAAAAAAGSEGSPAAKHGAGLSRFSLAKLLRSPRSAPNFPADSRAPAASASAPGSPHHHHHQQPLATEPPGLMSLLGRGSAHVLYVPRADAPPLHVNVVQMQGPDAPGGAAGGAGSRSGSSSQIPAFPASSAPSAAASASGSPSVASGGAAAAGGAFGDDAGAARPLAVPAAAAGSASSASLPPLSSSPSKGGFQAAQRLPAGPPAFKSSLARLSGAPTSLSSTSVPEEASEDLSESEGPSADEAGRRSEDGR